MAKKLAPSSIRWRYQAVNAAGKRKKGVIAAESRAAAIEALGARGLTPFSVSATRSALDMEILASREDRPPKFKLADAEAFARQFAGLVAAGVSTAEALEMLAVEAKEIPHRKMLKGLASKVMAGTALSTAMADYPRCFDEVFRAHVLSGERTGDLPGATQLLAESLSKQSAVSNKIKQVTSYPKLMAAAIVLIVTGILLFLVPMYEGIYQQFGAELPGPTKAVMAASGMVSPINVEMSASFPFITDLVPEGRTVLTAPINVFSPLSMLVGGFFGWRTFRKRTAANRSLNARIDRIRFKFPIFGRLWKANMLYRFFATLSGSLSAGLSLQEAIDVAGGASGSDLMRVACDDLRNAVTVGRPLSRQMAEHPHLFDSVTISTTATGEKTGEMPRFFAHRAKDIDGRVAVITAGIGARIEVALLLIMALGVGLVLVSLYLPIFNLSTTVGDSYTNRGGG